MVNTFLVSSDFAVSAAWLDDQRLWKQILEAKQIVTVLTSPSQGGHGWSNHPATLMWTGYIPALQTYINAHLTEWARRGRTNNSVPKYDVTEPVIYPWWMYTEVIYFAYRAALIRKNPEHYAALQSHVPEAYLKYGYFWPSKAGPFTSLEEAVTTVNTTPLDKLLAPAPTITHCSGSYKNGRKCYAKASRTLEGQPYCGRHKPPASS